MNSDVYWAQQVVPKGEYYLDKIGDDRESYVKDPPTPLAEKGEEKSPSGIAATVAPSESSPTGTVNAAAVVAPSESTPSKTSSSGSNEDVEKLSVEGTVMGSMIIVDAQSSNDYSRSSTKNTKACCEAVASYEYVVQAVLDTLRCHPLS